MVDARENFGRRQGVVDQPGLRLGGAYTNEATFAWFVQGCAMCKGHRECNEDGGKAEDWGVSHFVPPPVITGLALSRADRCRPCIAGTCGHSGRGSLRSPRPPGSSTSRR